MFAVVVFCGKSESVEAVPLSWITPSKTHCHWPNTKNSVTISKAVKTMQSPKADWKQYKIRIMMETGNFILVC